MDNNHKVAYFTSVLSLICTFSAVFFYIADIRLAFTIASLITTTSLTVCIFSLLNMFPTKREKDFECTIRERELDDRIESVWREIYRLEDKISNLNETNSCCVKKSNAKSKNYL